MAQATKFTAKCYGQSMATSMSDARVSVWTAQIEKPGVARVPKLALLPPTTKGLLSQMSGKLICKHLFGRIHYNLILRSWSQ